MKAIMISIRPQHVVNILNGLKTLEIRKRFPKDYVGWVYIYVTHGRQLLDLRKEDTKDNYRLTISKSNNVRWSYPPLLNGKVVARFWCDKVEEITPSTTDNFTKDSCLTIQELENYLWSNILFGYAIHITNLEIFDKPKEINEFRIDITNKVKWAKDQTKLICKYRRLKPLTRAPQSLYYVEL